MSTGGPLLSTLLSQALVALTIEIDDAYEQRAPHATTEGGGMGPWLISYGMWANYLRLVPADGIASAELAARAGCARPVHPAQPGMIRWGYVSVTADPTDRGPKPAKGALVVRPTSWGTRVAPIWAGLAAEVEDRWRDRFGESSVTAVRSSAEALVARLDIDLPGYLPVVGPDLHTPRPDTDQVVRGEPALVTALANVLHAFALAYETGLEVPLPVPANVLRVVDEGDVVRVADLPTRAGIGKEAARWAIGRATPELVTSAPDPSGARGKVLALTPAGEAAVADHRGRTDRVERDWTADHGDVIGDLRRALEAIVAVDAGERLLAGMASPPGCWRASRPPRTVLPHFPMVLHRGAFPDGS